MSADRPSYDELLELVARQQRQLEALTAEVTRLRSELDDARRAGQRQAAPFRKGPPKPDPKRPGRKSGEQHGTHAHRLPPPPEQIGEIHEAHLPDACPHCSGGLVETEVARQYQTEIPRQPLRRQFNVHIGRCRRCGRRVQGRHPLQTSDALGAAASQVGPDAQAAVVALNKEAGLSHGKVAACLDTLFGLGLTRGASTQVVLRAAERLRPAHEEVLGATRQAGRLSADETGWRVGGHPAWLHVWVSEQATCYAVDRRRSAEVLERVIGIDWDGVLVHDGFASYDRFTAAIHQQCVAHLLRRAREMLETATRGAVRFPRQVVELFTGAVHLRNEYRAGHVPPAVWGPARDEYESRLLPLLVRGRAGANEALSGHILNHFESWFTFLTDASVPATNWEAEQAVRPAVVNRKVWGGNRTEAGAEAQGILSSVLRTCRQQAKSAVDFVSQTLRAFGNRFLPRPILLATR
ncbi:MAG TPA: IS66 family transposase [Tepidisphaeraceae bacterium]|nr:IS66 family transposase [Tepidisphaeraceae bacterium]